MFLQALVFISDLVLEPASENGRPFCKSVSITFCGMVVKALNVAQPFDLLANLKKSRYIKVAMNPNEKEASMKISGSGPAALKDIAKMIGGTNTAQQNELEAGTDRVEISFEAREVAWAADQIKEMPDVDLKKVAKVKAMLEKGAYRVDGRKTAAKMLEEALLSDW